jgi:uncharacterized damage-inducible protein DinB
MNVHEPALSFRELFAYTDYLAARWLKYFRQNSAALDVTVGGRTLTLCDLATHIFQVEEFFSTLLLQEDAGAERRPAQMPAMQLEDMERVHRESHRKLEQYLATVDEKTMEQVRTLGPVTVSSRKILAQVALHSVHHWAQVAMAVRQAGYPAEKPQDIIASPVMT